jgi:hypothetical protein
VADRKAFRLDYFRDSIQVAKASPEVVNTREEERRSDLHQAIRAQCTGCDITKGGGLRD